MEHIRIIELDEEQVKLIPDEGYMLYNTLTERVYSDAIVNRDKIKFFIAIEK